jgi:sugar lactone lactonase YvrE
MTNREPQNFVYLNQDNRWPGLTRRGLELDEDGVLRLASLPRVMDGAALPTTTNDAALAAGLTVDAEGTIWLTDPQQPQLLRLDGCDGTLTATPCLGGYGTGLTQFSEPRGVAYHPQRGALMIADSGNHRIQIFDPDTAQVLGMFGALGSREEGAPAFTPIALAVDGAGNVCRR